MKVWKLRQKKLRNSQKLENQQNQKGKSLADKNNDNENGFIVISFLKNNVRFQFFYNKRTFYYFTFYIFLP